jgi:hypothetical protein
MLCLLTVSPWRSSTGLGTSEAYSASWRWPGLETEAFDEDERADAGLEVEGVEEALAKDSFAGVGDEEVV